MAVTSNTLIGKTRGSIGEVTFATWKGLNVMKGKAQNAYSDPSTAQVNNNSKFALMVAFYRAIAEYVTLGFKALAVGKSEYNAFMQENPYSLVVSGSPGSYKVDTSEILVSKGPELITALATVGKTASGADAIVVDWGFDSSVPNDSLVYALAFNNTTGAFLTANSDIITGEAVTLNRIGIGTAIATTTVLVFYVNSSNGKACDTVIAS